MQLFAFDKKNRIISAAQAPKKTDYFCRECGGIVRLRGGAYKKTHFFHLASQSACRQSQKSAAHLQVQYFLEKMLLSEQCRLERHFPEIGRIADVAWEDEKIIFEVQCSSISKEEVESRNKDYQTLGYQVVWILHDKRFNRWKVSAAEMFLRTSPYYYTNMDSLGNGEIYDQIDTIQGGVRRTYKKLFNVQLNQMKKCVKKEMDIKTKAASILELRWAFWPFHFHNDLIDKWMCLDSDIDAALLKAFQYENSTYKQILNPVIKFFRYFFSFVFLRPYTLLFRILLEKACR